MLKTTMSGFFDLSCVHVFVSTVCVSEENYKKAICNLLPKLKTLDGELGVNCLFFSVTMPS